MVSPPCRIGSRRFLCAVAGGAFTTCTMESESDVHPLHGCIFYFGDALTSCIPPRFYLLRRIIVAKHPQERPPGPWQKTSFLRSQCTRIPKTMVKLVPSILQQTVLNGASSLGLSTTFDDRLDLRLNKLGLLILRVVSPPFHSPALSSFVVGGLPPLVFAWVWGAVQLRLWCNFDCGATSIRFGQ